MLDQHLHRLRAAVGGAAVDRPDSWRVGEPGGQVWWWPGPAPAGRAERWSVPAQAACTQAATRSPRVDAGYVCTYTVRMNLTLSLDDKVVAEARKSAAALGLSLNQAVRDYLTSLAGRSSADDEIAEVRRLSELACGDRAGWRFDRDELHQRA